MTTHATETVTDSGLVVPPHEPKPTPFVLPSFGSLKAQFFDKIPHANEDLAPSEIAARVELCKVTIQHMRNRAFRDRDTSKLHDVHILTHELQLAIGALKKMQEGGRKIYMPGDEL